LDTSRATSARLLYIDNLRWCAICMVVVMHAAVTYSPFGSWYYREHPDLDLGTKAAFAAYQSLQHAISMGLLFGIAGFFAGGMVARRGIFGFVRERLYRLGWPLLFYTAVLGPLTEYYVAQSWWSQPRRNFAADWLHHLWTGQLFSGSGPLWFCLVLLLFSGCFALVSAVRPVSRQSDQPLPGARIAIAWVVAMTAVTFAVGIWAADGTTILNVSIHDFPQYPFMFAAGVAAWRGDWLRKLPSMWGRASLVCALVCSLVLWSSLFVFGGALQGELVPYAGGWHWQAFCLDFWRSMTCVSMSAGLVTLYRDRFHTQGPVTRFLSRNAFGVYVCHAPVLIAITRALHESSIIPQWKFAIASILGILASFVIVGFMARRVPVLGAVL
jgi:glucans biosynthesis protein C